MVNLPPASGEHGKSAGACVRGWLGGGAAAAAVARTSCASSSLIVCAASKTDRHCVAVGVKTADTRW
jgi:hypothetical protein